MTTGTKEKLIITALKEGAHKGFSNVSLGNLASAVNIKKSSIYSHFESFTELKEQVVSYCEERLKDMDVKVDFKATSPEELLENLANTFLLIFGEEPLCWYYVIMNQQRTFDSQWEAQSQKTEAMIEARIRIALEYSLQKNWLDINDTDIVATIFSRALENAILKAVSETKSPHYDFEWELERLIEGLCSLFRPKD